MKQIKFVACLVLAFFLAGCSQTVSRPDSALNGALVGAGVGALVGGGIGYATTGERKQPPPFSH